MQSIKKFKNSETDTALTPEEKADVEAGRAVIIQEPPTEIKTGKTDFIP